MHDLISWFEDQSMLPEHENLSWELQTEKWAVVYPVQILPYSLYKNALINF